MISVQNEKWIFGSARADFLWILFPGLVAAACMPFLDSLAPSGIWFWYSFILRSMIDSGHVYVTIWRTYWHREERDSHPIYWITPIGIILLTLLWMKMGFSLLWSFVVYATLYHNVRQFYGINKWYQKLNSNYHKVSDWMLYLLCLLPVFIMHFRTDKVVHSYYAENDLFRYPNETLLKTALAVYIGVIALWIASEVMHYRKVKRIEVNRIFGLLTPASLYAIGFIFGHSSLQIIGPSVASHGISYFGLMSLSLKRTGAPFPWSFKRWFLVILLTAIFFGSIESLLESNVVEFPIYNPNHPVSFLESLIVAIYLTPLFCHYIFDAHIWRSHHREAALVFKEAN